MTSPPPNRKKADSAPAFAAWLPRVLGYGHLILWTFVFSTGCSGRKGLSKWQQAGKWLKGLEGRSLEFRLIDESPDSEAPEMKMKTVFWPWEKEEVLRVEDKVLLDQRDMAGAGLECYVTILLTPDGAKKIGEITKENVGRRIAVLLDGGMIAALGIREPTLTDAVTLGRLPDEQVARELVTKIGHAIYGQDTAPGNSDQQDDSGDD